MGVDLSYLQPYFSALDAIPHLLNQQDQAVQQQSQLDETKRHNAADEDIAGRHADLAEGAAKQRQQQTDLENAVMVRNQGWKPLTMGDDGKAYDPNAGGAAVPEMAGATTGMTTPVTDGLAKVGGQAYQIPTWQEQQQRTLQQGLDSHAAEYGAKLNREGWSIPDSVSDTMGIPRGQKILPEHADEFVKLHNMIAPPDKQFKPEPQPSMVTLSPTDSKLMGLPAGTKVPMDEYKARGTVAAEASRAARGDGGRAPAEKPATKAQFGQVAKDKATALEASQKQLEEDLAKAKKLYAADDTFDLAGAKTQAYKDNRDRSIQAQKSYEERLGTLTGNDVGHNDWADRMGEAQPAAAPGSTQAGGGRGAAAATPKIASMADVGAYAKQFGKSQAEAVKDFQAKGYKIGAQ